VLSQKVVILVALACLLRVSEIASIDASSLSFSSTGAKFTLLRLRKAQRSGAFQSFSLPAFSNSSCCPVEALRSYVDRTAPRRNNTNINYLFIALISPFKMVTASTISRWIRKILLSSGIDTQVFGAHSARGAGASKALASGASVDGILRSGHWARESTFARFYKRNVDSSVATAVIGSAQS
jgi:site-specific recombinase XerD